MADEKKESEARLGRAADQTIREIVRDEIDRERKKQLQTESQTSEPILASIPETGRELRVGRTKVYKLMGDGELEWVKIGDRRLIVRASIKHLVKRLQQKAI